MWVASHAVRSREIPSAAGQKSPPGRLPAQRNLYVAQLASAIAVVPGAYAVAAPGGVPAALWLLGVASVFFGAAVFVQHGNQLITGAGSYCLAAGVFVGGGCMYYAVAAPQHVDRLAILDAGSVAYATTVAMYALYWRTTGRQREAPRQQPFPVKVAAFCRNTGLLLLIGGLGVGLVGAELGPIPDAAAFDGSLLLGLGVFLRDRNGEQLVPWRLFVGFVSFGLYVAGTFGGGGRLVLVGLAFAFAMVVQRGIGGRSLKPLMIALILPVLVVFAFVGRNRNMGDVTALRAGGLISMVNPLNTFAEMVERSETGGGPSVFLANAVVLVPRDVWPAKPSGFGRVITEVLRPDVASEVPDLTMAALNQGEWYYVGGMLGVASMVVIVGALVYGVDRKLNSRRIWQVKSRADGVLPLGVMILAAGLPDLAWGGTYLWLGRATPRLGILALVWVWASITSAKREVVRD